MNRDLVFFVSGLSFGVLAGYFAFRALMPAGATGGNPNAAVNEGRAAQSSSIGLEEEPKLRKLDEEEMRHLEGEARKNSNDSDVRTRIGSLYMEAGRYDEAVPWLEESVRLNRADLHARNHLAISYLNLGRLEQAVGAFEENLETDPGHPASLLGLGRIKLYVQQDIQGGLALWEKLVQVAPDSTEASAVKDELEALKSAHAGS
ncbi:MAG: tetratricopeptide repeat protein [Vicinamibacteria bacterium]